MGSERAGICHIPCRIARARMPGLPAADKGIHQFHLIASPLQGEKADVQGSTRTAAGGMP